ncbi:hypothetical protein PTTW11_04410 [Pyrenophora teres f. teres]|uniref:Uncharacterized protein n=1 Tax=Pyrenophora teres f. teres TaxID=97479 RepID=A0A6S6VZ58_9PLEO|nr:hypothetical protein PTTW11_04410 [Pyrenophora teres f. teres]
MKAFLPLAIAPLLGLALARNSIYCSSVSWNDAECPGWKAKGCCNSYNINGHFSDGFKNGDYKVSDDGRNEGCTSPGLNYKDGFVACVD